MRCNILKIFGYMMEVRYKKLYIVWLCLYEMFKIYGFLVNRVRCYLGLGKD